MSIQIKELNPNDYDIVRKFAIGGMNLNRHTEYEYELYFYSKYYIFFELLNSTQIFAAYENDKLVGVLFAEFKNEPKKVNSFYMKIYVKSIDFIMNVFYKGLNIYMEANKDMFNEFKKNNDPDGEIRFFAVDPNLKGKGIGTLLLKHLENIEKGKKVFLYTDSGCTYQFYEHRGFKREQERNIILPIHGKDTPLTCFLFSKSF